MQCSAQNWLKIALFNLVLIALLGVTLRYKIAFSLPFIDQKHLLQAHSHFAFTGWISHALMVFMVSFLSQRGVSNAFKKYHGVLVFNLVSGYGMLLTFPFQGYGLFSIAFSTLSIITAYFFTYLFWKDLNKIQTTEIAHLFFKAALLFNVISSFGAFLLAWLMANKIVHQNWYLATVYFFLHFQYNGWFFFASGGLWFSKIKSMSLPLENEKKVFWLFALACIPCYFLSVLWIEPGKGIYALVVIAAFLQVVALTLLLKSVFRYLTELKSVLLKTGFNLLALSLLAFTIKIMLQLFSTIPFLNRLAYGFRPIVIGYLHLVLLGFITLFLLGYAISGNYFKYNKALVSGAGIFTAGIILNEILLMLQGTAAMQLIGIPFQNEMLLGAALVLLSGTVVLFLSTSF